MWQRPSARAIGRCQVHRSSASLSPSPSLHLRLEKVVPRHRHGVIWRRSTQTARSIRPNTWTVPSGAALGGIAAALGWWMYHREHAHPSPVEDLLRKALRAQQKVDQATAVDCYRKAYQMAKARLDVGLEPVDWLKISGIGIKLGTSLEEFGRLEEAIEAYDQTYLDLERAATPDLSHSASKDSLGEDKHSRQPAFGARERIRMVTVAQELARLRSNLLAISPDLPSGTEQLLVKKIEDHLTWSVEEILRLFAKSSSSSPGGGLSSTAQSSASGSGPSFEGFELPGWVSRAEVGGCLESLGEFYARRGNVELALPLYLHALSVLIPAAESINLHHSPITVQDRCHAATLMNNIAQALVHPFRGGADEHNHGHLPASHAIRDATSWASKSLALAQHVMSESPVDKKSQRWGQLGECRSVRIVSLHNLGTLAELRGDQVTARRLFRKSKAEAEAEAGAYPTAVLVAEESLQKLASKEKRLQEPTQST